MKTLTQKQIGERNPRPIRRGPIPKVVITSYNGIVGELIFAFRQSGMTQMELARRSGVPQGNISILLHGKTDIRLSTAQKLAQALEAEIYL